MTWKEAKEQGYRKADVQYTRGYISRKVNLDEQKVMVAKGTRKGQLYIDAPCYCSTRYHFRIYIERRNTK